MEKKFVINKTNWIEEQSEDIIFKNGGTVYLLGKQYKIKLVEDNKNDIVINNKYMELHIKNKYINDKKYIEKEYNKWLKKYSLVIIQNIVLNYQETLKKYDIKIPQIEIRQMKTSWGSCIPSKNKLTFNLKLIKTPICCIEYVVLHELIHFRHKNHSTNFCKFITIFMPDWKKRKKLLDEEFIGIV